MSKSQVQGVMERTLNPVPTRKLNPKKNKPRGNTPAQAHKNISNSGLIARWRNRTGQIGQGTRRRKSRKRKRKTRRKKRRTRRKSRRKRIKKRRKTRR